MAGFNSSDEPVRICELTIETSFVRIGEGRFATVFTNPGYDCVVVKQVKDPSTCSVLNNEFKDLELLHAFCDSPSMMFKLPQPLAFHHDYGSLADSMGVPHEDDMGLSPHALYVMSRVWPLSYHMSRLIRKKLFPKSMRHQPFPPFLARLYLGRDDESRSSGRFNNPENFPLYASRIESLNLPASEIAAGMGETLGTFNFCAMRDGRGIEFVLGGNPINPLLKQPGFFCIDFNEIRPHNGDPDVIVHSIIQNDPYVPRPQSQYWSHFAGAYMSVAEQTGFAELATQVLQRLVSRWGGEQQGTVEL